MQIVVGANSAVVLRDGGCRLQVWTRSNDENTPALIELRYVL